MIILGYIFPGYHLDLGAAIWIAATGTAHRHWCQKKGVSENIAEAFVVTAVDIPVAVHVTCSI